MRLKHELITLIKITFASAITAVITLLTIIAVNS